MEFACKYMLTLKLTVVTMCTSFLIIKTTSIYLQKLFVYFVWLSINSRNLYIVQQPSVIRNIDSMVSVQVATAEAEASFPADCTSKLEYLQW